MHIVIPMSGAGLRFQEAGYTDPKPLIKADGKPIIEHVVNLFPADSHFTFICTSRHLEESKIREVLEAIAPGCAILEIAPHKKGPVYAVSKIFEHIDNQEEVIVNYCDFAKYWDYGDFIARVRERDADGAISAYKGFHPHMLGGAQYAFIRSRAQWMLEIREKQAFSDNSMEEYASDGTYYFKRGSYLKKYFKQLIEKNINLNGEYYVSLSYNLLKNDGFQVFIYEIQHMLQWGNPSDLQEYQGWSDYFKRLIEPKENIVSKPGTINLILLAGEGKRFAREGYALPKPLIEVSGKPMVLQSVYCMPASEKKIFVCLKSHLKKFPLEDEIRSVYPDAEIIGLAVQTAGQACTCEAGLSRQDADAPLLVWSCDNGPLWDTEEYQHLIDDERIDALVWSFKNYPASARNPQMYGWLKVDRDNNILAVSVKEPLSGDPRRDQAIAGNFYFKKAGYFLEALKRIYEKKVRVNGEFYIDSCINELIEQGLKLKVFEVQQQACWGTPDELKTYVYWQSFFHKCAWHPYTLEGDFRVRREKIAALDKEYRDFRQPL